MAWFDTIVGSGTRQKGGKRQRGVLQRGDITNGEVIQGPRPVHGERAAQIRAMHDKFPTMKPGVIARKVGCDPSNVTGVLKRYANGTSIEELREYQANQADIFDAVGHRALASITDTMLAKSNPLQLTTMAAICLDKARLVRGQATSINVTALLDIAEAMRAQRDNE